MPISSINGEPIHDYETLELIDAISGSGWKKLSSVKWEHGVVQTNPSNEYYGKIFPWNNGHRIVMTDKVYAERDTYISADSGFTLSLAPYSSDDDDSYIYNTDGYSYQECMWHSAIFVPAGIWYRISVQRATPDTSETADIALFASKVSFSNSLSDAVEWTDGMIGGGDVKGRYTWRIGQLKASGSEFTSSNYMRMASIAHADRPLKIVLDRSVLPDCRVFFYDDDGSYLFSSYNASAIPSGANFMLHFAKAGVSHMSYEYLNYISIVEMPSNFLWRGGPTADGSVIVYVNNRYATCDAIVPQKPMRIWLDDYSKYKLNAALYADEKIATPYTYRAWENADLTMPAGQAFRLCTSKRDNTALTDSELEEIESLLHYETIDNQSDVIDGIRADVSNLKQRVSVLEGNELPDYYESATYSISGRCDAILALNPKRKGSVAQFVFLTDHHANADWQQFKSKPLMDYVFDHTLCDMFVNGGDMVDGKKEPNRQTSLQYTKDVRKYWNALLPDACELSLMVAGNHDGGTTWNPILGCLVDQDTLFSEAPFRRLDGNAVFDPHGRFQYYVDDAYHKIRWLVCNWANNDNVGDWDDSKTHLVAGETYADMYSFISSSLRSMRSGWTAVLFNHIILHSSDMSDQITAIEALCDAYNDRSTVTAYSMSVDFSDASGTVAAIIGGHSHFDHSYTTSGGMPVILTTTDNCGQQYVPDFDEHTAQRDQTIRHVGTTDEQAFDVFTIDTQAKTINATRIGYGSDRSWNY